MSTLPKFSQEYSSVTLSDQGDERRELSPTSETSVLMDDDNDFGGQSPTTKWSNKHILKIILGAGVGSLLEFYSFGLVAYFETELKEAFFPPSANNYDSLLMEFSLYGTAFAMRPFGGLIFGAIGDKYGRVYSLRISLMAMIVPTILYAVLPNYSSIGALATILVFLFRIVQGLCVGGEMSTALVYIVEEAPSHMKATLTGYLYAASCGSYLSLIVYSLWNVSSDSMPHKTSEWTWRLAFASCAFIGIFGCYIRKLMPNSYEFDAIANSNAILNNPISVVFSQFYVEFFVLFVGYIASPIVYYSQIVWLPAYLQSTLTNSADAYAYDVQIIAQALGIVFTAMSGHICDKYFGIYPFLKLFWSATIVNTFVCYSIISVSTSITLISFCQILMAFNSFGGMAVLFWCVVWIPDARIRNTMTGITYNLGMALFVSTLFDVETYLADRSTNFGGMYAGMYVCALCLLTFCAIIYAQNYHSWKNYHFYGSVNPHNIQDKDQSDISDDDIDMMQNAYAVI